MICKRTCPFDMKLTEWQGLWLDIGFQRPRITLESLPIVILYRDLHSIGVEGKVIVTNAAFSKQLLSTLQGFALLIRL